MLRQVEGFRLSEQQARLWSLYGRRQIPLAARCVVELEGPLEPGRLRRALERVVQRHEILRTVFPPLQGTPFPLQAVTDAALSWELGRDLSGLAESAQAATLAAAYRELERFRFDLEQGPTVHASLTRRSERRFTLFLALPSLTADARTLRLLVDDTARAYAGSPGEGDDDLLQYVDFSEWQRELLDNEEYRQGRAFWHRQPPLPELDLVFARPAPEPGGPRGGASVSRASRLGPRIETAAMELGVAPSSLLLACWKILLWHFTGRGPEIAVGYLCDGRPLEEVEHSPGPFATYLPVHSRLRPDLPLNRLVQQVDKAAATAREAQEFFTWDSLKAVDAEHPALAFGFDFEEAARPVTAAQVTFQPIREDVVQESFRTRLACRRRPASLDLEVFWDADLLGKGPACLLEPFSYLVDSALRDPGQNVGDVRLLGRATRHRARTEWNDTTPASPRGGGVHELLAEQAGRTPDAVVLVEGSVHVSYGRLDDRSRRLAVRLRLLGVGPESRVGIALDRSVEMVVALRGALEAGGAFVPLDPGHPAERLEYLVNDAEVEVIVTRGRCRGRLPAAGRPVVDLDEAGLEETDPRALHRPRVTERNLAYVLYTSGSTGRPKGVAVPHGALAAYLSWCREAYLDGPGSGVPVHSALGFDFTLTSVLAPMLVGERLILLPEKGTLEALARLLEQRPGCRLLKLTPSHLRGLAARSEASEKSGRPPIAAGRIVVGGEALTGEDLPPTMAGTLVINEYGPTEATVGCIVYSFSQTPRGPVPIGRPIPGLRACLLDGAGEAVSVGLAGEIFIAGEGLARGYQRQPGRSAAVFLPDLSGPRPGERSYRSGDLGRFRADGVLEFLGRADRQVKIRGYRLEPGEIEAALARHPAVSACIVMKREGRLVAWIVPVKKARIAVDALREHLAARLPEYMIPAAFVTLEALPTTPNGKLDRDALPAPDTSRPALLTAFVAPCTPEQRLLAGIWRDVLGLERVGIDDNFFTLGGDSIQSIQVVSRALQAGLRLTPQQIFENQTLGELARMARRISSERTVDHVPDGDVPLTPMQHWFFEQDLAAPEHFNQGVFLEVDRSLGPAMLARALAEMPRRHAALRLRFARQGEEQGGGWRQFHAVEAEPASLPRVDLAELAESLRDRALTTAVARLQASLSLERGPLSRSVYFDFGDAQAPRLLWTIHHLLVDGVSWRILIEELRGTCRRLRSGKPLSAGLRTTSFQRWSLLLAEEAGAMDTAVARPWLALDSDMAAALPGEREGRNTVSCAETVETALDEPRTRALLGEVSRAYRTRIDDLLLAALGRSFARVWQEEGGEGPKETFHLLVDREGHGREPLAEELDLSRTVGWFTALHPVRLRVPLSSGPGDLLKDLKEQLRGSPRGLDYGALCYLHPDADLRRRLARLPRAPIVFNYLGQLDAPPGEDELLRPVPQRPGPLVSPCNERSHALEVNAAVAAGRLRIEWTYSRERHDRATIAALGRHYLDELGSLIDHCLSPAAGGVTPSDFPLARLDASTLDRVVAGEWDLEGLYPLSGVQEGMLFHYLYEPSSRLYLEQVSCAIEDDVDVDAFERAWQRVVARHPALRTSLAWTGLEQPLQKVHRQVDIRLERHDWRRDGAGEARRLDEFLAMDRERGIDLGQAPAMRLAWIELPESAGARHGGTRRYRFIWTFHHVILDGWSSSLLVSDVLRTYAALRAEEEPAWEDAGAYESFIAWQLAQDPGARQAFWRGYLEGFSAPTRLHVGRPRLRSRPTGPGHGDESFELSAGESSKLDALRRRHRLTPNTWFQGAWALVLGRYSGQRDVVYGVTVSGRPPELAGVERMIGLFINTLPLRGRIDPGRRLADWLGELQAKHVEARHFESSSLVEIQGASAVPGGEPLFETLLTFENYPVDVTLRAPELPLRITRVDRIEKINYPLAVVVVPGDRFAVRLLFDPERFDRVAVRRLGGHLRVMLRSMIEDPDAATARLSLLSDAERRQLLEADAEALPYPPEAVRSTCVHHLFETQAARRGDAVAALVPSTGAGPDIVLTYGRLNRRADELAERLRRLGVGPESRVGLRTERGERLLVGILGILKAGGAYVPLDPRYPAERLAFMTSDAGVRILVTDEDDFGLPATAAGGPGGGAPRPAGLAYVIYTSGSTGRPKGVGISHANVVRLFRALEPRFRFGPEDVWTLFHSAAFDFSVWEIWGALAFGGRLVVVPRPWSRAPDAFADLLVRERVSVLNQTPSAFRALARVGREAAGKPALRWVVFGGEALEPKMLEPWFERFGDRRPRLVNMYGITETTVHVTFRPLGAADCRDAGGSPIGRPIADLDLYVTDAGLALVPLGVAGELQVGGAGLARGYLRRPRLTAERFVPSPWSGAPGNRLYRTGDRVRRVAGGDLEFLGRLDDQVKIRGFRIEPGEIEKALAEQETVGQCQVLVDGEDPRTRRLVAFVTPAEKRRPEARSLRERLGVRLPEHMIPAAFVVLEKLPLTTQGKVDRAALARLALEEGERPAPRDTFVAPRTAVEELLVEIWRAALQLDHVGVEDDFFQLGGNSLLATRVTMRINTAFKTSVPIADLFTAPTVASLAAALAARESSPQRIERIAASWRQLRSLTAEERTRLLAEKRYRKGVR